MERGLLWLPLLLVFGGLAWAGWNEYRKVEAYRQWASGFDQAKYDIYSVIGMKGKQLTWGKPTQTIPIALEQISLDEVEEISLRIDDRFAELSPPPRQGSPALVLSVKGRSQPIKIPFTEIPMAIQWVQHLRSLKDNLPDKS